jgi:hypothetical protein
MAPELPELAPRPPLPLFDDELPVDEQAAGIANVEATTPK